MRKPRIYARLQHVNYQCFYLQAATGQKLLTSHDTSTSKSLTSMKKLAAFNRTWSVNSNKNL